MPALSVSIDGNLLATVCADGLDSLSVGVRGTLVDEEIADIDVHGGSYPENGDSTFLIWVGETYLQCGQVVTVSLLETASSTLQGKTIEEMFPDEQASIHTTFKPLPEMVEELRGRPKFREKFAFRLESSLGTKFVGETKPGEFGFAFSVHWNSFHPERASVSLHSYSLEDLEARGPLNYYASERICYGDSVRFELVA